MRYANISILLLLLTLSATAQQKAKVDNVILVTLDGMRWQEVFGGADSMLLSNAQYTKDSVTTIKSFGGSSAAERREKLMPFFWTTIARRGQLFGNRQVGSKVNTSNKMWFSYPGYNEILTGLADDIRITSNDAVDNPNKNVLEFINAQKGFEGKVAAFTSWENFPWIINVDRNKLPVNAGLMKCEANPNTNEKMLNELMFQLPDILGQTRLDAFTFHFAFEYLVKKRPRLLYVSFDETDHFAHEGKYDHYLASAHYIDGFLKQLWDWIESQPGYKGKTALVITTDHGRGDQTTEAWRHHGSKVQHADQIWIAMMGGNIHPSGESKGEIQLYQNQVAATVAELLGFDFSK